MSSNPASTESGPMVSETKNLAVGAEPMECDGETSGDKSTTKQDIHKVSKINGIEPVSASGSNINGLSSNQDADMEMDSAPNITEKANVDSSHSMEESTEVDQKAQADNDTKKIVDGQNESNDTKKIVDGQNESVNDNHETNETLNQSSHKGKDRHLVNSNKENGHAEKKPNDSIEKSKLLDTVKDDDGGDILITLNEDNDTEKQEGECDANVENNESEMNVTKAKVESSKSHVSVKADSGASKAFSAAGSLPAPPPLTPAPGVAPRLTVSSNIAINPVTSIPLLVSNSGLAPVLPQVGQVTNGTPVVQQGSQLGYITKIGNQTLFVPLSAALSIKNTTLPNSSAIMSQLSQATKQPGQIVTAQAGKFPTIPQAFAQPKSSWEMMEMMKWEVANRIADNWNWSIAFHPKKEELSTITNFILELGSDVVKEQVYKDIIQIQTKKKESGELKDQEIESLEKMKTVYDNTKKKVEHLELGKVSCERCDFQSESKLVIENHYDYPHFEPEWDINKGWMVCTHCNYRTKVIAQFIFHMHDMHKRQAKFVEREPPFQCPLCPLNTSTKNKLEKHQAKCMKHFKLNMNLQPYYHDVNYCMKSVYYKPKKPVVKPPPPPPAPAKVVPKPTMNTRQQSMVTGSVPVVRPAVPLTRPQRPIVTIPPPPLQNHAQNIVRPTITRPVLTQNIQTLVARLAAPQQAARPRLNKEMAGFEVCELCGGYVKDRQALRIHFYYAHKVELPLTVFARETAPLSCEVCKMNFWTTQGLAKHKTTNRHFSPTATSQINLATNQCFMCLRKVSNIFTHVEQTHGMTMKDLVLMKKCIMCGVTSPDKRALEKHMASIHGIVIKANDYVPDKAPDPPAASQQKPAPSVPQTAKNIGKINYCVFCEIQFPDNIQLTVHCLKKHATCKTCGMVVQNVSLLTNHDVNCMKANKKCSICGLRNMTPDSYATHLKRHIEPCSVKLLNMSENQLDDAKEKLKREYKPAVISLDSDEDSEIEVVETEPKGKENDTKEGASAEKTESEVKTVEQNDQKNLKNDSKSQNSAKDEGSKTETVKLPVDDNCKDLETNEGKLNTSNVEVDHEDSKKLEMSKSNEAQTENVDNTDEEHPNEKGKSTTDTSEKSNEDLPEVSAEKLSGKENESNAETADQNLKANDTNRDNFSIENEDSIDENKLLGTCADLKSDSQDGVQEEIDEDLLLDTEEEQGSLKRKLTDDNSTLETGAESKKLKLDDGSSTYGGVDNSKMDVE